MHRNLFVGFLLFSLMVCATSTAWAGALDDVKAGISAANRDDYGKAIGLFTKAIESGELPRENLSKVYFDRGLAWGEKGDYDRSNADKTKAIEINPNYAEAYNNRGRAWGKKDDYDKAIADYTKAIEINPKYADAYLNRSLAWGKKGDYDRSNADKTKAIDINQGR